MKIRTVFGAAAPADILSFEGKHGVSLPASYKSFILNYNGGVPSPSSFVGREGLLANLAQLFPITGGRIEKHIGFFDGCVGNGLIPIGLSGGGDYFFLDVESGEIFLWQHEIHEDQFGPEEVLWLADSIDELLSRLEGEEDEAPGEIEELGRTGDLDGLRRFLLANSIEAANDAGRTVAMEAARYGNLNLLKACIEEGARTKKLLHYAARNKSVEVIDYLLSLGLDINERDEMGRTPLSCAIVYDEIRAYLATLGAVK